MGESAMWIIGAVVITIVLIVLRIRVVRYERANKNNGVNNDVSNLTKSSSTIGNKTEVIENRQELLAAICAAIAEENGVDISAIRVVSFKRV